LVLKLFIANYRATLQGIGQLFREGMYYIFYEKAFGPFGGTSYADPDPENLAIHVYRKI